MDNQNQPAQQAQSPTPPLSATISEQPKKSYKHNLKKWLPFYVIVAVLLFGGVYYFVLSKTANTVNINSFESCAKVGNPILESFPHQCKTPDGKTFTENIQPPSPTSTQSRPTSFTVQPSTIPPSRTSGITGKIMLGPTCPVVQNPPEDACKDKPYQATVVVKNANGTKEITRFSSDSNGEFSVSLPSGVYQLESISSLPPILAPKTVTVIQGKYTEVNLQYDSGIR